MSFSLENVKIAVALRSARTAIGWSQQEFANRMNVAKSTVARIETVETSPRAEFLTKAMALFHEAGVRIDFMDGNSLSLNITTAALHEAAGRLDDEAMRRSDRKTGNRQD